VAGGGGRRQRKAVVHGGVGAGQARATVEGGGVGQWRAEACGVGGRSGVGRSVGRRRKAVVRGDGGLGIVWCVTDRAHVSGPAERGSRENLAIFNGLIEKNS
jgi:hypothetical protein